MYKINRTSNNCPFLGWPQNAMRLVRMDSKARKVDSNVCIHLSEWITVADGKRWTPLICSQIAEVFQLSDPSSFFAILLLAPARNRSSAKCNIKREGRKADNYGIRSNISPRLASFLHEERIFAKSKAAQACVGRLSDRIFRTTIRS